MSVYFRSSVFSVILHVAVALVIILLAFKKGCDYKKQPIDAMEFTIAIPPSEPASPPPEPPKTEPPKSAPPEPPKTDDIPLPTKEKPPETPKKVGPPKPKKVPVKVSDKRVTRNNSTQKLPPLPQSVDSAPKLTEAEIRKLLAAGAKISTKTQIPQNDLARNVAVLSQRIRAAWDPPPPADCGSGIAEVEISLGRNGSLNSPKITKGAGSAKLDASLLEAIKRVGTIPELTPQFLSSCEKITLRFNVKDID